MGKWSDRMLNGAGQSPPPATHQMPDGSSMAGPEHPGAVPGGTTVPMPTYRGPQESVMFAPQPTRSAGVPEAGFADMMRAGFTDTPEAQARVYARALFPGEPEPQALRRFQLNDGQMVFKADDGKYYGVRDQGFWPAAKEFSAKLPAELPGAVLSGAGALFGGMVGRPFVGAGVGAGAGEAIRQGVGKLAYDDPYSWESVGLAAAMGAGGERLGRLASGAFNAIRGTRAGVVGRALGRDAESLNLPDAQRAAQMAKGFGVDLNAAQATGSRELVGKFKYLRDMPASADIVAPFDRRQFGQAQEAALRFLDTISDQSEPLAVGNRVAQAAGAAREGLEKSRTAASSPLYQEAFDSGAKVDTYKAVQEIDRYLSKTAKGTDSERALLKVRGMLVKPKESGGPRTYNLDDWNQLQGRAPLSEEQARMQALSTQGSRVFVKVSDSEIPELKQGVFGYVVNPTNKEGGRVLVRHNLEGTPTERWYTPEQLAPAKPDQRVAGVVPSGGGVPGRKESLVDDLEVLNNAKQQIDVILSGPKSDGIDKGTLYKIGHVKSLLTQAMDEASPVYQQARALHETASGPVNQFDRSILGSIAQRDQGAYKGVDAQAERAALRIFSGKSPEAIKYARQTLEKVDPGAWQAAVRIKLQDALDWASKPLQAGESGNIGGKLHQRIWGDVATRKQLQAAMTPEQFENLENFTEVMRRLGTTWGKESATASRQELAEQFQREALGVSRRFLRAVTTPLLSARNVISQAIVGMRTDAYKRRVAEAILDPENLDRLRYIKTLPPQSRQAVEALTSFLSMAVGGPYMHGPSGNWSSEENPTTPPARWSQRMLGGSQ